jgi:predicted HicB family RNase H-like nuclease
MRRIFVGREGVFAWDRDMRRHDERQLGRDVPSPAALGQWRQRAPRSLHEKPKIVAAREGVSLNAFVTSVLAEAIGKRSA